MKALILAGLAAMPAAAQLPTAVKRGDLEIRAKVKGTVVAEGIFRLKSNIEGRVVAVTASSRTWAAGEAVLSLLANKELAAILDAHGSTGNDVLEERWQKIYKPVKVRCPEDCYVLRVFVKANQPILPQGVILEAAKSMSLVGHVAPENAHRVQYNQLLEYWPVSEPGRKLSIPISNYDLDPRGAKGEPGGHFRIPLDRDFPLPPGTTWEGIVLAEVKKQVLVVPTRALIRHGGTMYLPVAVSTGVTTAESTELIGGVEENRPILILEAGKLGSAERHEPRPDPGALERHVAQEAEKKKSAEAAAAAAAEKAKPRAKPKPEPETPPADRNPAWGPDPYEE